MRINQRATARFNAVGTVLEVLGENMAPGMEIEIALRTHGIPHTWPEEVTKEVAGLGEQVPEKAKEGRIDLRALPLVTIDGKMPATSTTPSSVKPSAAAAGACGSPLPTYPPT